jgi:hypothetical protein
MVVEMEGEAIGVCVEMGAVSDVTLAGILDGVEIGLQATNCSNTIHEQIWLKVLRRREL